MKFDKIVGFGDSWMWGDELMNPELVDHPHAHPVLMENTPYREGHCFLGLLGSHYNVPTQNFGIAGGSLQSTIWTYLWWLEHEQLSPERCLILVALTDSNRHTFYNPDHVSYANDPPWNRFVHSAWVHSGNTSIDRSWVDMVKSHMVLTDCTESQRLNFLQTVLFFDGQHYRNKNVLQFNSISAQSAPCLSLLYNGRPLTALIDQAQFLAPMGHPNEKGHVVIRDSLIKEIDCAILAQ